MNITVLRKAGGTAYRDLTIRLIPPLIRAHAGRRPERLRRLAGSSLIFEAEVGDRPMVFKAPLWGMGTIASEAAVYDILRRAGVRVPEVIAVDLSRRHFPAAYMILEALPGVPVSEMDDPDRHDALLEAGRHLRVAHAIQIPGSGTINEERFLAARLLQGTSASWQAMVEQWLRDYARVLAAALGPRLRERILQVPDRWRGVLEASPGSRLLHGDLMTRHILADPIRGTLTGLVDFGHRLSGDPAWDLARLTIWPSSRTTSLTSLALGYEPDGNRRGALLARLPLYRLCHVLEVAHHFRYDARFPMKIAQIGRLVDEVERAVPAA